MSDTFPCRVAELYLQFSLDGNFATGEGVNITYCIEPTRKGWKGHGPGKFSVHYGNNYRLCESGSMDEMVKAVRNDHENRVRALLEIER